MFGDRHSGECINFLCANKLIHQDSSKLYIWNFDSITQIILSNFKRYYHQIKSIIIPSDQNQQRHIRRKKANRKLRKSKVDYWGEESEIYNDKETRAPRDYSLNRTGRNWFALGLASVLTRERNVSPIYSFSPWCI